MPVAHPALGRCRAFCDAYGLRVPILLAPMAGACPASLSIAVGRAGGLGAAGVLLMSPETIATWVAEVRAETVAGFQLNVWIPGPPPVRDAVREAAVREFLADWGPPVPVSAADVVPLDFASQCDAMIEARPAVMSSIMGLFAPALVDRLRAAGIRWFATVTTVAEAVAAVGAGADAVVAQGMEAGGHRGSFDPSSAERELVGLFSLVPAIADAVEVPVIAAGGIVDARGVAAALTLGASAVSIGTGFLRCPEAMLPSAWSERLARTPPEQTIVTRAFSGRPGRSVATSYAQAASAASAPDPAPYPTQRSLTQAMRDDATQVGDVERMQAWAGQSAALARAEPAADVLTSVWEAAQALLGG